MSFDADNSAYDETDTEFELRDLEDYDDEGEDEDEEFPDDWDCDESMDGDFDSGMTSAGFGTDEDYGHYGGDDGFYGDE